MRALKHYALKTGMTCKYDANGNILGYNRAILGWEIVYNARCN